MDSRRIWGGLIIAWVASQDKLFQKEAFPVHFTNTLPPSRLPSATYSRIRAGRLTGACFTAAGQDSSVCTIVDIMQPEKKLQVGN